MFEIIRKRVGRKIAVAVGAGVVAALAAGFIFLLASQRNVFFRNLHNSVNVLHDIIRHRFYDEHPKSKAVPVQSLQEIRGNHREITSIMLLDSAGRVKWSTTPSEIGGLYDHFDEVLAMKLDRRAPRIWRDGTTVRMASQFLPEAGCRACHQQGRPIGYLLANASDAAFVEGIYNFTTSSLLTGLGILAVTLALVLVMVRRYLGTPLKRLLHVMRQAEKGNFLVRAEAGSRDEISLLGQSFNKMLVTITDLYAGQLEKDRELIIAQEELKYQEEIEEKGRMIEEANQTLERRVKELSLLFEITKTINSTLELDEILHIITTMLGETMGYQEFAVLLLDEKKGEMRVKSTWGFANPNEIERIAFRRGEGISWVAAETGRFVLIPDTSRDNRYLHYKGKQLTEGSFLSIPMKYKDKVVGVLNFSRPGVNAFPDSEVNFLTSVANQAAVAIINASLHQTTVELSITDQLTSVFNRRYFDRKLNEEVQAASRYGASVSMVILDIDHFKAFNDRNGHLAGDDALQRVAEVLMNKTRRVDTVARYGGEEFCVILPKIRKKNAFDVAEKLRKAVQNTRFPGEEGQPGGKLTISLGISAFPEDGAEPQALIDAADIALYHSKRTGRNRAILFEAGMEMPREAGQGSPAPEGG
jgi:diguanylate cyclase (GGDEF)-like protein